MTKYKFKKGDRVEALRGGETLRRGDRGTVMENSDVPYIKWDREIVPGNKDLTTLGEPSEYVWHADQDDLRLITDESNPTVRDALLNAKQAIDDALNMLGGES